MHGAEAVVTMKFVEASEYSVQKFNEAGRILEGIVLGVYSKPESRDLLGYFAVMVLWRERAAAILHYNCDCIGCKP